MTLKQLSVFLENKPGALSRVCRVLATAGINIQTFALADSEQFGILRLIVQDWDQARKVLEQNQWVVKVTDVVTLKVPDRAGGLSSVLDLLEWANVNVEYAYAFTAKHNGEGLLVFRFDQPEIAIDALRTHNIRPVSDAELTRLLSS